jgi:hypothetical protein
MKAMNWFRNLKKWQRGGLIGCAVGLAIICLFTYACIINDTPGGACVSRPGGLIKLLIYFGHSWLSFLFSRIPLLHSYYDDPVMDVLFGAFLVVLYGGSGAIVGRVQQMLDPVRKWLITGLLALFLLILYVSGFVRGFLSFYS